MKTKFDIWKKLKEDGIEKKIQFDRSFHIKQTKIKKI
jgi:hypothetical protein